MEFLAFFGDGCVPQIPAIGFSVCRGTNQSGFTMPSYGVWHKSLGPAQMTAFHSCLEARYVVELPINLDVHKFIASAAGVYMAGTPPANGSRLQFGVDLALILDI